MTLGGRPRAALTVAAVAAALLLAALAGTSGAAAPPRVTLIGDSPATGIQYNPGARAILAEGITLQTELAPCRRLVQPSCPYEGTRPPSLLEVVQGARGQLGDTVIVAVGYNDFEEQYGDDIRTALAALRDAGVKRILWATLRAARHPYLAMNDAIRNAAEVNPDLGVVDWNAYSRSHPDWFQEDGIHLSGPGAEAMARLFHDALDALGVPVVKPPLAIVTTSAAIPRADVGKRLVWKLRLRGGTPPYRWILRGPRRPGLTLSTAGRLTWLPHARARIGLTVRVVDADGDAAGRMLFVSAR
jgi:hypothetical protein